jgi:hypothetical protein
MCDKVERDLRDAREGAGIPIECESQGKSSETYFWETEDLSGATDVLPPFMGSVKFCKIHVPKNFREARASEQWDY